MTREWTIMIYMAGDNNLSEDMITALKDLKAFAGNDDVNIVVFYDTNYPPKRISIYDFTRPANRELEYYEIENAVFDILHLTVPPVPSAEGFNSELEFVSLKKFVPWVLKQPRFKANNYALILSGHSDGILGKTLLRDDNPPTSLDLKGLGKVLKHCCKQLNNIESTKDKFDLLGFDGCLMAMLESTYQVRKRARYSVASEGNIPNAGWNYAAVFQDLFAKNGKLNAKELAVSIVDNYSRYNFDFIASGRSINISAFDLSYAEIFAKRFDLLALILLRFLELSLKGDDDTESLTNAIIKQKVINYILQAHYYSQTFMHEQAVDILDFEDSLINSLGQDVLFLALLLSLITDNPQQTSIKQDSINGWELITESLNEYLTLPADYQKFVMKSCSVGAEYQFSKGVSVFFPWSQMPLKMIFFEYKRLKFNKKYKNWKKFIRRYIELTNRTPETQFLFSTENFADIMIVLQNAALKEAQTEFSNQFLSEEFINILLAKLLTNEKAGRQYIGRQYIGRQYIGRGDAFYDYFQQWRNYPPFKLVDNFTKEQGLTKCYANLNKDDDTKTDDNQDS